MGESALRIVFMGTPDYAVPTLAALCESSHEIIGVFAQPDKPVGRKRILTAPPVKQYAVEKGIPVYQPNTLRDGVATEQLREMNPDLIVVVAYGKILPKEILQLPKFGCINGHASLLPAYRGASPIQWCIVCGEKETGVTIMQMDEGMDTGDILQVKRTAIGENETAEELFERLSTLSASLMLDTVAKIEEGSITPIPQSTDGVSYAPILKKEMAELDFSKTAQALHNAIRGYYSWPCAFFFRDGKRIKVLKSRIDDATIAKPCGLVVENSGKIAVSCGDGTVLSLELLQPEGSRAMTAQEFLRGHALEIGEPIAGENHG